MIDILSDDFDGYSIRFDYSITSVKKCVQCGMWGSGADDDAGAVSILVGSLVRNRYLDRILDSSIVWGLLS